MRDLEELFRSLGRSAFRSRFHLREAELRCIREKGMEAVLRHARSFVESRLAPAEPVNDGRQTPMRNHPVFVAQHATATCCRGCLAKWHGIAKGRELSGEEIDYVARVIERWLESQCHGEQRVERQGELWPEKCGAARRGYNAAL